MSIIRAIKLRLGLSVTPANNFALTAEADNGTMKLVRESGQDIMTVDAAGKVAFPQTSIINTGPAFSAYKGATQSISAVESNVVYEIEEFDTANAFNGTLFTPLVAGYYQVTASLQVIQTGGGVQLNLNKNALGFQATGYATGANQIVTVSALIFLNGSTDFIYCSATSTVTGNVSAPSKSSKFSACLVRAA